MSYENPNTAERYASFVEQMAVEIPQSYRGHEVKRVGFYAINGDMGAIPFDEAGFTYQVLRAHSTGVTWPLHRVELYLDGSPGLFIDGRKRLSSNSGFRANRYFSVDRSEVVVRNILDLLEPMASEGLLRPIPSPRPWVLPADN